MSLPLAVPCSVWQGLPNPSGSAGALSKQNSVRKWFCVIIAARTRFCQLLAPFLFFCLYVCSYVFLPVTTGNQRWCLYCIERRQEFTASDTHVMQSTKVEIVHKHKMVTQGWAEVAEVWFWVYPLCCTRDYTGPRMAQIMKRSINLK